MSAISPRLMATLAGVACLLHVFDANALRLEPGIGAGIEYTSNAALESDNEQDDWIGIGYLGFALTDDTGPLQANAVSSLTYQDYTQNTFSDQYYFNFNGNADWAIRRDRFIWKIADSYSQQPVQSLAADTPDNRQNSNVFSTGPDIFLPFGAHHRLSFSPRYDRFYYEKSDTDNQQFSLLTSWLRQTDPSLGLSLNLDVTKVDYEQDRINPDYTIINYYLGVTGERSRSQLSLNAGATEIMRDRFQDENGFLGNLAWTYQLNRHSSISASLGTELTDTSSRLAQSAVDPDMGAVSDQQTSGDVVRADTARLTYNWTADRVDMRLSGLWSELDYKQTPDDQRTRGVQANLGYRIAPRWGGSLFGGFERQKQTDTGLRNDSYRFGAGLDYRLSRKLTASLIVESNQRDSNLDSDEYSEYRGLATLVYGFGSPQARRSTMREN